MVYVTGDTHGRFERLFPRPTGGVEFKNGDYVIICGDFGGIWKAGEEQEKQLDKLETLPCTILFADGNHENYDLLEAYPISFWHGGKVQIIRKNLIHLMRGQIYDIEGKSYFVMGGAASHDIFNGILDIDSPDFDREYSRMRRAGKFFRVKGLSWWERELPSEIEIQEAWENLCQHEKKVDFVISHCLPDELQIALKRVLGDFSYKENRLTAFLQRVYDECCFEEWYCGHFHRSMNLGKVHLLYEDMRVAAV